MTNADRSMNLLRNLCAVPYPAKNMLEAIEQFKAEVPVLMIALEASEREKVLATTAKLAALAKFSVAREEVKRLRAIVQRSLNILHEAKDNGNVAETPTTEPARRRGRPPKIKPEAPAAKNATTAIHEDESHDDDRCKGACQEMAVEMVHRPECRIPASA